MDIGGGLGRFRCWEMTRWNMMDQGNAMDYDGVFSRTREMGNLLVSLLGRGRVWIGRIGEDGEKGGAGHLEL